MKEITEVEKEIGGIRTTTKYQEMLAVAEEMAHNKIYNKEKMLDVYKYCLPEYSDAVNFPTKDILITAFLIAYKNLLKPYAVLAVNGNEEKYIGRFETFEEAFEFAESIWDENYAGTYYDNIRMPGLMTSMTYIANSRIQISSQKVLSALSTTHPHKGRWACNCPVVK